MVEGPAVQMQLAQDQQLRILAAALDSTHDPVSVPTEILGNKTPGQHSLELSVFRYTAASIFWTEIIREFEPGLNWT